MIGCMRDEEGGVVWDGREFIWAGDGKTFFRGVGRRFLVNEVFEEAFRKLLESYKPSGHYRLCLFLPCAYGKPYSQSYIHYLLLRALRRLGKRYGAVHQVIVSNVGIVPRELEERTPFACYDWNPSFETAEVKRLYSKVLTDRLTSYIRAFGSFYDGLACYLRHDSDSYRSMKEVEGRLKVKIPNLALERVPEEEVSRASLGIYGYEQDLMLVAPSNLNNLVVRLKELLP